MKIFYFFILIFLLINSLNSQLTYSATWRKRDDQSLLEDILDKINCMKIRNNIEARIARKVLIYIFLSFTQKIIK